MAYTQAPLRRVYLIKDQSWTHRGYKITTPDELSCLYTVQTSSSHPEVILIRHLQPTPYNLPASFMSRLSRQFSLSGLLGHSENHQQPGSQINNDHVVATVNFHTFSSKIDISFSTNQAIVMKCPDAFSSARRFESLTPLGTLEWKRDRGALGSLVSSNLKLVDGGKRTVARYEKKSSMLSKENDVIALLVPELYGFLDIVVITCLATLEYKRTKNSAEDAIGSI
ncbi:hypothetical protein PAAG_02231 [Paracoccidioides lutzii Pb01]|uniref:DUF6593 domain-containing protein n=1 Tax=Paracoccidioides lutzii (strain ATCC MYA-826 / Pb01) TaxID=502779 RepID=C1GVF4_PARBA|nr:hypothetical protein PAAG_02231 [Paracoccidioides lutzii Pb01]EEH40176.1 hypothetical protein PAAG_02231 [Paracoccidioides lutzii Pb01]